MEMVCLIRTNFAGVGKGLWKKEEPKMDARKCVDADAN